MSFVEGDHMKNQSVIAYDLGTSGVKIVALTTNGELIGDEREDYSLILPQENYAEQNPIEIWEAVCRGTKRLIKNYNISIDSIKGIAFGTQWKAIIPIDKRGNVLHNAIIWLDQRAHKQASYLNNLSNSSDFTSRDYHARLMWFRENEPDLYEQTDLFLELNSYLKYKLCEVTVSDLSNNFIFNPKDEINDKYNNIVEMTGIDINKFPPLVMPEECVGQIVREAAIEIGLAEGTKVFAGFGDIPAVAVGSGCSKTDQAHIYLGSSGWLAISKPDRELGIGELYQSFYDNQELLLYVLQSAGMAQDWAVDQLYRSEKESLGEEVFDLIDKEIATLGDIPSNVLATPWFHGELPPLSSEARACFINLSSVDDRRHMMQAMRESIGFSLRVKIQNYTQDTGDKLHSIHIVGGPTLSDHWMQTISNILNIPVFIPANARHAGAIGVAYCAMVGLGIYDSFAQAQESINIEKEFYPNEKAVEHYNKLFGAFSDIYPALEDIFMQLNKET